MLILFLQNLLLAFREWRHRHDDLPASFVHQSWIEAGRPTKGATNGNARRP